MSDGSPHMDWKFSRQDGWEQIPLPWLKIEVGEDLEAWLKRNGYSVEEEVGYGALAKDIYPLWHMRYEARRAEWMEEFLGKCFRVFHGHDADSACSECDPDTYERLQEMRAKRSSR